MAKCAVYAPPKRNMPYLAVVIDVEGGIVACEPVKSISEGESLLVEVTKSLPAFLNEARKARH